MITTSRILIVDDHPLFREVLREFLSQEPDFQIVGEAGTTSDAIRSVGALSPHLVLTDLNMPDTRGVEAVTELKRHFPNLKVLVLSLHREREFKQLCREAGAVGYVVKDAVHDELCDCIRTALGGRTSYLGADALDELRPDPALGSAALEEDSAFSVLH